MLKRLLVDIAASGSASGKKSLALAMLIPATAAGIMQEWLAVPGVAISIFFMAIGFEYEFLQVRLAARKRKVLAAWPIVVESLESAALAGMSLLEAIRDLAESDQLYVAGEFAEVCRSIDSGVSFASSLDALKNRLATHASDFTIELLKVTNEFGSSGYVSSLRNQTISLRQDAATQAELEAKQGWVVGTAKLAVIAPWLIVIVLSIRPENAALYRAAPGTAILILGLVGSALALKMVYRIGVLNLKTRVFA